MSKYSQLRIIAGKWRSRKVTFPNKEHIRPTTDRLRETLFNWLAPHIQGANCLDAFAGSGVLGLEALSRGASHVTFIDISKENIIVIAENARKLGCENEITLIPQNFFMIENLKSPSFDIIFLDPPFHQGFIGKAIKQLEKIGGLCASKLSDKVPLLYIEFSADEKVDLTHLEIIKQKKTKHITYGLYCCKKNLS